MEFIQVCKCCMLPEAEAAKHHKERDTKYLELIKKHENQISNCRERQKYAREQLGRWREHEPIVEKLLLDGKDPKDPDSTYTMLFWNDILKRIDFFFKDREDNMELAIKQHKEDIKWYKNITTN